jgi:hypothetical protein
MGTEQQTRWIRILGVAVGLLVLEEVLRFTQPAPEPAGEAAWPMYRLVDPATGTTVGSWGSVPQGRSTFLILRDGHGIECLILEADPERGGRVGIRDGKGQWHWYPAPPPE